MRVLVATDAWHPQVNGVVRTYERLALEAPKLGFEVSFLAPPLFRTLPCPTYPEIRLALASPRAIARHVARIPPRLHPYRHGGTHRAHDQALLPQDAMAVHHQLSHALSRICLGPPADSRGLVLRAAAAVP